MGWIKRNLVFVIAGVLALGLLGLAGFYGYQGWSRNSAAFDKLNEIYATLHQLNSPENSPGNDKLNKTEAAREQEKQIRDWIAQARKHFQVIAPIPKPDSGPVTASLFGDALRRTLTQLQHEADAANVMLPPQEYFSFGAEFPLVKFAPGSLDALPTQLGEVKTIAEILFTARVNALDGVQRIRMSDDDMTGSPGDYMDDQSVTNDLAVITPYTVVFRAFSPEIAQVLSGFASSPNCFVVKGINVQPAGDMPVAAAAVAPAAVGGYRQFPGYGAATPPPVTGKGGLQTVLNEQLLRVTMVVELVKLLPKN
jgi:hypothetical protein